MKHYHIRQDENKKCDLCGEKTVMQFYREPIGWQTLGSVYFAVQSNLAFLKVFRRWCTKCKKSSKIKYQTIESKS